MGTQKVLQNYKRPLQERRDTIVEGSLAQLQRIPQDRKQENM